MAFEKQIREFSKTPRFQIDAPRFRDPKKEYFVSKLPGNHSHWVIPSDRYHRLRYLVEMLGYYIKREAGYDSPPYDAEHLCKNEFAHAFGIAYGVGVSHCIGACCFRLEEWSDREPSYCLEWVWIHPYKRRSGILSSAWPEFQKRYGDFAVMPPVSKSMIAFLKKMGHPQGKE